MDWRELTKQVVDRISRPALIVDASRRVQLVNQALATLLGSTRDHFHGKRLTDVFELPPGTTAGDALRYGYRIEPRIVQRCAAARADGLTIPLTIEIEPLGREQGCWMVSVIATQDASSRDADYEIRASGASFGKLIRLSFIGREAPPSWWADRSCHDVLHGLGRPCNDCPAQLARDRAEPVTAVRPCEKQGFEIVRASMSSQDTVRVRVRELPDDSLRVLWSARISHLAHSAGLSPREREVLDLLVLGRSLEEIASSLGISARTVKFHQANLLAKLGAESRLDLLRLLA